ncbi:unnamed protein product [marine sediment metagenome]|uniref:Uncharacterized protein n=1 Tax=marine sediment metagenome TaxID=412755 RepID=X0W676_9ZZZZ
MRIQIQFEINENVRKAIGAYLGLERMADKRVCEEFFMTPMREMTVILDTAGAYISFANKLEEGSSEIRNIKI